jgi:glutamate N-acetyltransferase/amino-acid N-acetyltransferase
VLRAPQGRVRVRSLLINTGTAGTSADGLARRARRAPCWPALGCAQEQVLPFPTGVIMETLPHDRIEAALPAVLADANCAVSFAQCLRSKALR